MLRHIAARKKEKKAVSALVATVLLILITVTAVGIIWGLIMPTLQKGIMAFGQSCINVKIRINTKEGYTCFNPEEKQVSIMVSHGAEDFKLYAVQIILSAEGISQKFEIMQDLPGVNEDKTYNINLSGTALEDKTVEAAAIAPVIKIGNSKRLCSITSKVKITSCI